MSDHEMKRGILMRIGEQIRKLRAEHKLLSRLFRKKPKK